ncbi:MAG: NUDIX domain-containing protein [Phenylobacterium sp.]|uniref:NUDIX domain-containing protein n=1 Tax=Phenylobacterium sp. TaxID=1871053 RepID=UPI002732BCE2|nr:NUDIX domain-containing protein [Phenylobacterium sp.]MDP3745711.1 NUDIX domain-containing protein [Phenylobacterium sp.]
MRAVPQFGERVGGRVYADRPAAFGIAERDGKIALVRIEKPDGAVWRDLPGGAVDPGETAEQAVVREYGEEAGLRIAAGQSFAEADQFFLNTEGKAFNNRGTFFAVLIEAEAPGLKVDDDHTLIWIDPTEAIRTLRHEAHAWAVGAWLRR